MFLSENDKSEFEDVVKMKDGKHPNPNTIHPIAGYDKEIYVKPTITNPNIFVGDFAYTAHSGCSLQRNTFLARSPVSAESQHICSFRLQKNIEPYVFLPTV